VFLACSRDCDRKDRLAELAACCTVAWGLVPENKVVIGLATEIYEKNKGFSMDALYYFKDEWTQKDQEEFDYLKNELGFFSGPEIKSQRIEEYPKSV